MATSVHIYGEAPGQFGESIEEIFGITTFQHYRESTDLVENSSLDYTILRLPWLYNDKDSREDYHLTQKGEPFEGTQVARSAVAKLIVDIIKNPDQFHNVNLGASDN